MTKSQKKKKDIASTQLIANVYEKSDEQVETSKIGLPDIDFKKFMGCGS